MTPPETHQFAFRFTTPYRRAARIFGVTPERSFVRVDETQLEARYGRWHLETPLENITAVELTGPYRFWKTAGPARLGVTDLGLTFASNRERGVLISFATRVRGIEATGLLKHGELTVTVERPEQLRDLLLDRIRVR